MNLHEILLASKMSGKSTESADLSDYYTKSQIDSLLSGLENYDDTEIKSKIAMNRSTLGYQCKNLLKNTAVSKSQNGITVTVNEDGSVTAVGTATSTATFILNSFTESFNIPEGEYIYSGCTGGSNNTYLLRYYNPSASPKTQDVYDGDKIINHASGSGNFALIIYKDVTVDQTFYPMLRYTEITDSTYEPYRPSVEERLTALENAILEGF